MMATGERARVAEISETAQDYLKTIWSLTEWDEPPATTKALADRFGTTPAAVSDMIKRLAAQGLVTHEPYRHIELTARGERYAIEVVRRHRLVETFLVTSLGYSWDEVHAEAETLEHSMSDLMVDRIDRMLGHPRHDPHGDPIPAPDGTVEHPADAVHLSDAAPGRYLVSRVSDADPARLTFFLGRGLTPGAPVRVVAWHPGSQTVEIDSAAATGVALAAPAAAAVMVVPAA
jgi:DtxR family Mn-dependent transcriptional regulator